MIEKWISHLTTSCLSGKSLCRGCEAYRGLIGKTATQEQTERSQQAIFSLPGWLMTSFTSGSWQDFIGSMSAQLRIRIKLRTAGPGKSRKRHWLIRFCIPAGAGVESVKFLDGPLCLLTL